MVTLFNKDLIISLVKNIVSLVQGIKKVDINIDDVNGNEKNNIININVWLKKNIFIIKSITHEIQEIVYKNLSKQLDNLKINIYIHF